MFLNPEGTVIAGLILVELILVGRQIEHYTSELLEAARLLAISSGQTPPSGVQTKSDPSTPLASRSQGTGQRLPVKFAGQTQFSGKSMQVSDADSQEAHADSDPGLPPAITTASDSSGRVPSSGNLTVV